MSVQHIANQRGAFEAALNIARQYPNLPAAYTTVHTSGPRIDFQLGSLTDWETWREALATQGEDGVTLNTGDLLLAFDTVVVGYEVHVYVIDQIRSAIREQAERDVKAARQQEDPHDSPLHHDYTTPHDLPEFPAQRDRRHV